MKLLLIAPEVIALIVIGGLAALVGLLYLSRALFGWLYKIDDLIKNQETTNQYLKDIVKKMPDKKE